jgi:hypothetical protein
MNLRFLPLSLLLAFSFACPQERSKSRHSAASLVGTYTANSREINGTIVLREDGTYLHTFTQNNQPQREEGHWTAITDTSGTAIVFDGFTPDWMDRGQTKWIPYIEKQGGRVAISADPDKAGYFVKQ